MSPQVTCLLHRRSPTPLLLPLSSAVFLRLANVNTRETTPPLATRNPCLLPPDSHGGEEFRIYNLYPLSRMFLDEFHVGNLSPTVAHSTKTGGILLCSSRRRRNRSSTWRPFLGPGYYLIMHFASTTRYDPQIDHDATHSIALSARPAAAMDGWRQVRLSIVRHASRSTTQRPRLALSL
jgi:hypothetical protein